MRGLNCSDKRSIEDYKERKRILKSQTHKTIFISDKAAKILSEERLNKLSTRGSNTGITSTSLPCIYT